MRFIFSVVVQVLLTETFFLAVAVRRTPIENTQEAFNPMHYLGMAKTSPEN